MISKKKKKKNYISINKYQLTYKIIRYYFIIITIKSYLLTYLFYIFSFIYIYLIIDDYIKLKQYYHHITKNMIIITIFELLFFILFIIFLFLFIIYLYIIFIKNI